MKTSVDILCAIGTNSTKYAEFLKISAEKMSTTGCSLNWKCVMSFDRENKYEVPRGFYSIGRSNHDRDHGSINHTSSMHSLLGSADSEYTIIADTDIALLKMGWDESMFKYLQDYDCFGVGWGKWDKKYMNFPSIMFICFKTKFLRKLDWDLNPVVDRGSDRISRYKADKHDAKICSVPKGTSIKKDSGWRIPYFFQEKGRTGFGIPKVKVGGRGSQIPFADKHQQVYCMKKPTHMSEYILDGELYATHLQASRSKPWSGKNCTTWTNRINSYLKTKYGITLETK